jgi:hypothetical protein
MKKIKKAEFTAKCPSKRGHCSMKKIKRAEFTAKCPQ